jgi:hypothetical protein
LISHKLPTRLIRKPPPKKKTHIVWPNPPQLLLHQLLMRRETLA